MWDPGSALQPPSGAWHSWKNAIPPEWHCTHWTSERTIQWLRRRDPDKPIFFWMPFADPHQPFAPPRPYCEMHDPNQMPDPAPRPKVESVRLPSPPGMDGDGT